MLIILLGGKCGAAVCRKIFFVWAAELVSVSGLELGCKYKGWVQGEMKGKAGEKAEETMTWYQSITSKVNYAGSEGTRGGVSEGERDTWQHENIHHVFATQKRKVVAQKIFNAQPRFIFLRKFI